MDGNGRKTMKRRLCHCLKLNSIKYIRFRRYDDSNCRMLMGKVKSGEIGRRVKATEKDIDQVVKELNNETEPPEETFLILEEEVLSTFRIQLTVGV